MSTITTKICIVGAGPGGASLALFLAKKGISSTLLDKAKFPRDKICGDALSGKVVEVLKRLNPDLLNEFEKKEYQLPSWGVNFIAPNLKEIRIPFKTNFNKQSDNAPGYIAKRMDFDNFLVEQVKKEPLIELLEEEEAKSYKRSDSGWLLETKGGTKISSRMIASCDGSYSHFAKKIGGVNAEGKHNCFGIRAYYENVEGLDKDNFIELHFLKELLPGYFWIFPLPNNQANVGLGIRADVVKKKKINLKKTLDTLLEEVPALKSRFKNANQVNGVQLFPLPLGSQKRKISGDGYLLLGDAGALIDPFTGEGIGNALVSAEIASEVIENSLKANDYSAKSLSVYDSRVFDRLWTELSMSRKLQQLCNYPSLFNFVANKAQKNETLKETISCMFEDVDLRKRFKDPKFYLKLFFT